MLTKKHDGKVHKLQTFLQNNSYAPFITHWSNTWTSCKYTNVNIRL